MHNGQIGGYGQLRRTLESWLPDEFYAALKDLGKDVTYVKYPRQGHGTTEPRLASDRLRRYVCAFTDVLGMISTTETCEKGVPVANGVK